MKKVFFFQICTIKGDSSIVSLQNVFKNRLKEKGGKMLPNQQNIEKFPTSEESPSETDTNEPMWEFDIFSVLCNPT